MEGKIVLVTGGNSGMGKAAVIRLADMGAHVILLARNKERGEKAYREITEGTSRKVDLMFADLASEESIRIFAKAFYEKYEKLDVLINNAGVFLAKRKLTKEGFEMHFGVNYLGHFLLTMLLLKALENSGEGRIILVGSCIYRFGKVDFEHYNLESRYGRVRAYSQSKLAETLFVRELQNRLTEKGASITANLADPGIAATNIIVNRESNRGAAIAKMQKLFFLSPEKGAKTAIFLASDKSVAGVGGGYYAKCKKRKFAKRASSMQTAKKLFLLSEELCHVTFEENI